MLKNYLRIALRNIRKYPAHTILNLACLSVGIAGTLLILLYLNFELTYDQYHQHAARIYRVTTNAITTREKTIDVSWTSTPAPLGPAIEKDIPGVEHSTRLFQFWSSENIKLEFQGSIQEETNVYAADAAVFDVFTFPFVSGNPEGSLKGPDKIVISESLAKRIFGTVDAVGKTMESTLVHQKPGIEPKHSLLVTGVYKDMPKNVHLFVDALISAETDPELQHYYYNQFNVYTYLLLHPHTNADRLASAVTGLYTKYLDPAREPVLVSAGHQLTGIGKIHLESTGGLTYVYIFSGVGLLLLIISGISYVNLATAQASRRAMEVGLRKLMGSGQRQLVLQFLGESVVLTMIAFVFALMIMATGLRPLNVNLNLDLDVVQLLEPQLIAGILIVIGALGIVGGSYPAFFLAGIEPLKAMKDRIARKASLRKILVTIQLAVVIFVLVSTGIIYTQLQYLREKHLGFDKEHVITMTMPDKDPDAEKYKVFKNLLMQHPSIVSAATSNFIPGTDNMGRRPIAIDDSPGQEQKFVYAGQFGDDFLATMNIQISSGRNFLAGHPADSSAVIVNEQLVRAFDLKDPIGSKVRFGGKGNPNFFVIVGVVNDFHQSSLYTPIEPQMYVLRPGNRLFLKIAGEIPSALRHIEQSWANVFAGAPFTYRFLDDAIQEGYKDDQIRAKVFFLLSLLAVFICFLGLFGLASYLATQRMKEIGIRKIHGASLRNIVLLITRDFLLLALIAALPAFALSWYTASQWLENFAFRTDINVTLFILSLVFTLALTFVTTGLHAWRSASVNPLKNLRSE